MDSVQVFLESPSKTVDWVTIIPLLTALTAVLIGPIITFMVAKRQIIAPLRVKWTEELREHISHFVGLAFVDCYGEYQGDLSGNDRQIGHQKSLLEIRQELVKARSLIQLLLNIEDKTHVELGRLLDDVVSDVSDDRKSEAMKKCEAALDQTREILRAEWLKAKDWSTA